ncbi:uncharacterized protein LOC144906351 [Branchiostoma floridae x Branchiostoma belcheri]
MAHKVAVFLLFTIILSVSMETGNAWKFMKRNKSSGSNIARKVKRAYDQTWVDDAINAGCTPHQEPCQRGTFCCPASGGRFGMCHLEKDGNNRCEYVIVEAGPNSQGPVGLD